jgi:hypothetical protein
MRKTGVYKFTIKIAITLAVLVATFFATIPAPVKAAPDPIDLELDTAGYTPITFNNIKPGDSGIKTIELRNVGTKNGLVSIWLSDIINDEGLNPKSETGDISGDGELGEYLLLDIDTSGLSTNLALPATVNDFPVSATGQKYIKVIALKAGETRILDWYWTLPETTGNMVQGDVLSFTINYFLREIESPGGPGTTPGGGQYYDDTPVSEDEDEEEHKTLEVSLLDEKLTVEISADGILKDSVILAGDDGKISLELPAGTRIIGDGGVSPSRIVFTIEGTSILLLDNIVLLSPIYRLTGYTIEGNILYIQFDPPVRLTIRYDPAKIPENSFPPRIAQYTDEEGPVILESPVNYPVDLGIVNALIEQSGLFMVLAEIAPQPPPLPAFFTAGNLIISPHEAFEGDPVEISVTITNKGPEDGTYELYLIIDGIVRGIQKVSLSGKSSETLTFEVTNLAAGTHQIKVAGLTENLRIEKVAFNQLGPGVNWTLLDLSVAAVIITGMLIWSSYMIRARRRSTRIGI